MTTQMSPCTHEEADTRLILHASDCVRQGVDKIILRTQDIHVLVITVSNFRNLGISKKWRFRLELAVFQLNVMNKWMNE